MSDENQLPRGSFRRYERPQPVRYTMADLEAESGVNARTIRYYIAEGLLQPAYGRGPSAVYDTDHLLRLRYIQLLKEERLPLGEIKEKLNALTPEDIAAALEVNLEPEAEVWRHLRLHNDFQVMIRDHSAGTRDVRREQAFSLIVEYARSVIEDLDQPE
jgi:DNA-binding transcriptional MerR regulator